MIVLWSAKTEEDASLAASPNFECEKDARRFDDIIPRRSFHPVTRNAPRHFLRHRDEQRHERFI